MLLTSSGSLVCGYSARVLCVPEIRNEGRSHAQKIWTRPWHWTKIVSLVKHDLATPTSRMKSWTTDDDWHTRAADLLNELLRSGPQVAKSTLRELPLIPYAMIVGSQRIRARFDHPHVIWSAHTGGLGLQLLDPRVSQVRSRMSLILQS